MMRSTHKNPSTVTDYENLGLHSGAAAGNLGLVKFALDHGQPIDSVLNGVLPIHAACVNGNLKVLQYLIEQGANVNAPRHPRRSNGEKNRASGHPIGTTGSTPLHFAAAKGCLEIVELLLKHGAIVNVTDKYGSSPISVAMQKNHHAIVEILTEHDIRQREEKARQSGLEGGKSKRPKEKSAKLVKKLRPVLYPVRESPTYISFPRRPSLPAQFDHHHRLTIDQSILERRSIHPFEIVSQQDNLSREDLSIREDDDDTTVDYSDKPSIDMSINSLDDTRDNRRRSPTRELFRRSFNLSRQFKSPSLTSITSKTSWSQDHQSNHRLSNSLPITPYSNVSSSDLPMTPPESPVRQSIVAAEQNDAMDVISEPDMLPSSAFGREGGMSDKISCNEQASWWEQGEKPVFGSGSTLSGSYSTKPKRHARSSSSGYFWTKKENDGERKSVLGKLTGFVRGKN